MKHPSILKNADTTDFNKGNCGFIAASLIIFYAAKAWGWNYLYGKEYIEKSLVEEIQGNRPDSSWAPDIEDALNDYMNKKGATHAAKVNMWHIPADHTFYDRVKEDKPVILFGNMTDATSAGNEKINHAIVVYEVTRDVEKALFGIKLYSNYRYKVHYGMSKIFNDVIVSHASMMVGGLVNLHK